MSICENCQYEVRQGRKHVNEGDGTCMIVESDTEKVIGWSKRKYRDVYKRNNPAK